MSANGYVPHGFDGSSTPAQADMAAFDRLPRTIRDALNYAPVKFDAASAEQHVRCHGERAAGAAIAEIVAKARAAHATLQRVLARALEARERAR